MYFLQEGKKNNNWRNQNGSTENVITEYLQSSSGLSNQLVDRKDRNGNGTIRFTAVDIRDINNNSLDSLHCGSDGKICIHFTCNIELLNNFHVAVGIDDPSGQRITQLSNEVTDQLFSGFRGKEGSIEITLEKIPFRQGQYTYTLYSTVNGEVSDWIQNAGSFHVVAGDYYSTGKLPPEGQGSFFIKHSFKLR